MEQEKKPHPKLINSKHAKEPTPPPSLEPVNMDSVLEVDSTPSIDVSNHQYTLSMCCMLGTDEFSVDTDFLKLGEWNW